LRRSSRIVLLIGVFLAVVAFAGILVLSRPATPVVTPNPATLTTPTVYATVDIPLGTKVTKDMVRQEETRNAERSTAAFNSTTLVIGKVIRRSVVKDAQLTSTDFATTGTLTDTVETPAGLRAIAVQVDQATGVGTIIKIGDYVDVVLGITGDKFPTFIRQQGTEISIDDVVPNPTSVKVLIQGVQVLGTLLPPPPVDSQGRPLVSSEVSFTGRAQLVILGVTPQQTELLKFAQMDGSISLVLRSPLDFVGPDGTPVVPPVTRTTGIVLKTLVDQHGVLVPQIVATIFDAP
jgi:pilus assembly protein CpaB